MLMSRKLIFIILIIIFVSLALFICLPKKQNPEQINPLKNMPTTTQNQIIRQPAVAGQFYPADKKELNDMLEQFLTRATTTDIAGRPQILIVPHAGYVFSGQTAADAFKTVAGQPYQTVIILGSSHNYPVVGLALYNGDAVATPLGQIKVNKKMVDKLINNQSAVDDKTNIFINNDIHTPEHSLEVQLPFLQKTLAPGWQVVLGLTNNDDLKTLSSIAEDLNKIIQKYPSTLIVISSDLSHYPSAQDAVYSDHKILEAILSEDASELEEATEKIMAENLPNLVTCACGASAIKIGMLIADKLELTGTKLHYSNSGDTEYGDKNKVVGYSAVVFTKNQQPTINNQQYLSPQEQTAALQLARNTLELTFGLTKEKFTDYQKYPVFAEKRGVFVTLRKNGELRGCIGLIEPVSELGSGIIEMAKATAFNDSRFSPLTKEELNKIEIEISVLTPPQKISDPEKEIDLGKHGVIVRSGSHSGVFLPQVATETGWDLETFMGQLCSQKAGLPANCWKNGSVTIYTFEAQVFEEK